MILRPACAAEAELCYGFIEDGRSYQRSLGFAQWGPAYPSLEMVKADIAAGQGFVFCSEEKPVGYCCILYGREPAYDAIRGAWKTDLPYAVIHRMVLGREACGQGLSREVFRLFRAYCRKLGIPAIRIDTHEDNKPMQHILQREGFAYCGIVQYDGPRLAFELDL